MVLTSGRSMVETSVEGRQRHAQQRQSQRLALRVDAQRPARPARQDIVENEVQGEKVGRLVADDARRIQALEIPMDHLGGEMFAQPGEACGV